MSLIKCPECGKEISDKASVCPNCGCPASEWKKDVIEEKIEFSEEKSEEERTCLNRAKEENLPLVLKDIASKYPRNQKVRMIKELRERMGIPLSDAKEIINGYLDSIQPPEEKNEIKEENNSNFPSGEMKSYTFNGVYRYTLFGGKQEVRCPRCGSENCSHHQEQKIIPGKTKTSYSANLNPLKPFTLVNKKEKVKKKEQIVTESKFICNSCGYIFK